MAGPANAYKNYSPDKKHYVYAYKFNLYLCDEGQPEEKATQLSNDGVEDYTFAAALAAGSGGFGKGEGTGGAWERRRRRPQDPAERHLVAGLESVLRHAAPTAAA